MEDLAVRLLQHTETYHHLSMHFFGLQRKTHEMHGKDMQIPQKKGQIQTCSLHYIAAE